LIRKALTLHYRLLLLHYRRYTYSCSAAIVAYWPRFGRPRANDVGERWKSLGPFGLQEPVQLLLTKQLLVERWKSYYLQVGVWRY
jgi:hypothetical protein